MKCQRCGVDTPRLTRDQTRCPQCQREVDHLIRVDRDRRDRRVFRSKVLYEVGA